MLKRDLLLFASDARNNYRIPSVVATKNGSVAAFCNSRINTCADAAEECELAYAVKLPGGEWSSAAPLLAYPGWSCGIGSAVYDAETDEIMCFSGKNCVIRDEYTKYTEEELAEKRRKADEKAKADGITPGPVIVYSRDGGRTWQERPYAVKQVTFPLENGELLTVGGGTHGAAHGIQLRHGDHKGRLLCPSRFTFGGQYTSIQELKYHCYNNAIYSDDHGQTWQATVPVQLGTGEGTLIENQDGSVTYNSRAYYQDQKRYLATSTDGGETWGDFRTDDFLLEEKTIGCNASFLRVEKCDLKYPELLPAGADSITVFANPRAESRRNMTLCVSFDSGKTYVKTKTVWEGHSAYSSLDFNVADQTFYMLYERGERNPYSSGIAMIEFDLEWLLAE